MRIFTFLAFCCLFSFSTFGQTSTINNKDSIVLDFAGAIVKAGRLEMPVFIMSDDRINSLDFSFKINENVLKFDTIAKGFPDMDMTYFLNPNDRKLRLTSYSLKDYDKSRKFATIYFKILGLTIRETDINDISTLLNGDKCSVKLTSKTFLISNTKNFDEVSKIKLFPNPTTDLIHIECESNSTLSLTNISGIELYRINNTSSNEIIDLKDQLKGLYLLHVQHQNGKMESFKIIKE